MKKLTQNSLLLLVLMVALTGCDAATDAAGGMAGKAGDMAGDMAGKAGDMAGDMAGKVGDMAGIDFGDFDMAGMKEKFTGITDGFADVTAENADGLAEKVTDLSGAVDGVDLESLPAPAKTAVSGIMSAFAGTLTTAMEGISDEGIMGKLKPAVEPLLEKLKSF